MKNSPSAYNFPDKASVVSANGYADLYVNAQSRWNAVTSVNISSTIYQASAYWNSSDQLVIATRVLDGSWTEYAQAGITIAGDDNHDYVSIGIDPDGFIHVCYSMHSDALLYRKSDSAINSWTGTLTTTLSMVGTNESAVTYPTFINDPSGNLYFLFRDGINTNGDLFFYAYTHSTTTWAAATGTGTGGKLVDGKNESPTRGVYWEHPSFDSDFGSGGFMHLAFRWRVAGSTEPTVGGGACRNMLYVKWDGTSFYQADDTAQTVPITSANGEVADDTSGDNVGLRRQMATFSDSNGNPHIVYPKEHTDGFLHLFHAYHNGTSWSISQITYENTPAPDNTTGNVGLIPDIAIDRSTDTIYVIYFNPLDGGGIMLLKSTDFTNWTKKKVYPYYLGWWQPCYDYVEFERSGILYIQINEYVGYLFQSLPAQTSFPVALWKVDPSIW